MAILYIIVLNYNGWEDTIECLESLLKLNFHNFKIIVVDNNSSDNSISNILSWSKGEILAKASDNDLLRNLVLPYATKPLDIEVLEEQKNTLPTSTISIISSKVNGGFSAGNNLGIKAALNDATCKYVWLLNNDTIVEQDSLKHLINAAEQDEKIGLVGSKLLYYSNPNVIQALAGVINTKSGTTFNLGEGEEKGYSLKSDQKYHYIVGASMFAKRKFIEETGILSEDYFLYNEEPDWCLRGYAKGWKVAVAHDCHVYHKHGISTGSSTNVKSEKIDLIGLKSRLIFMKKFFPAKMPIVYLSFTVVIANRLLRTQFRRIPKILNLIFLSIFSRLRI